MTATPDTTQTRDASRSKGNEGKGWLTRTTALVLMVAMLQVLVPASAHTTGDGLVLKVAVLIPRTAEVDVEAKRYNQRLAEMTNNAVSVRIYWGGAAGDDRAVLRKMRTGQIDGAPLSLELVSNFVRQALVLESPALFSNYRQVDAVRASLTPDMNDEAYENGFKVMAWGDVGRLRLFSKQPIRRISDFKQMRPWLYPESEMLKEFYKVVGATGVPLSIAEVYGGLQTDMIDVIWASALLAAALQWQAATTYVSEKGLGFISGAFVFRRAAWEALPQNVRDSMQQLAVEQAQKNQIEMRKNDERTYEKLVQRGHIPVRPTDEKEWWEMGHQLRHLMIGRVYTKELVDKAEQISAKYKDDTEH